MRNLLTNATQLNIIQQQSFSADEWKRVQDENKMHLSWTYLDLTRHVKRDAHGRDA